eukprot:6139685-Amphidinium_carterae.1
MSELLDTTIVKQMECRCAEMRCPSLCRATTEDQYILYGQQSKRWFMVPQNSAGNHRETHQALSLRCRNHHSNGFGTCQVNFFRLSSSECSKREWESSRPPPRRRVRILHQSLQASRSQQVSLSQHCSSCKHVPSFYSLSALCYVGYLSTCSRARQIEQFEIAGQSFK